MWKSDNTGKEELLQELLVKVVKKESMNFPEICPNCHTKNAHLYFNRFKENRGGVWVWCSQCEYYIHGSLSIPKWWENNLDIPQDELAVEPDILEKEKNIIDKHVNRLVDIKNSKY